MLWFALFLVESISLRFVEASLFVSSSSWNKGRVYVFTDRRHRQSLVQVHSRTTLTPLICMTRQQQGLYSSFRNNDTTHDDDLTTTATTTAKQRAGTNTVIASNFWHSVVNKQNEETTSGGNNNRLNVVPCVPTLDRDGRLPASAYVYHGNLQNDVKETCRMAVAVDAPFLRRLCHQEQITPLDIATKLHDYIDAGLSTFFLKTTSSQDKDQQITMWAEENIVAALHRETPSSVLRQCQFVIPLVLPWQSQSSLWTSTAVRKLVLGSLMRVGGGDAIDCLQVQYAGDIGDDRTRRTKSSSLSSSASSSPYLYDVLDTLNDLKREGILRSVAGRNIPLNHLRTAKRYGFDIDSNQVDLNLLDASAYSREQALECRDLDMPLFASSPLAGGLLTDRYLGRKQMPMPWEFTLSERRHWNHDAEAWMKRREKHSVAQDGAASSNIKKWQVYQSQMLAELEMIARKHRVSMASVALRWTMQLDHVASTIATCRLLYPDDGSKRLDRVQQLRQVFRFELDKEDMRCLWELTGQEQNQELKQEELDNDERLIEEMMENDGGLFVPRSSSNIDYSNKKLWL